MKHGDVLFKRQQMALCIIAAMGMFSAVPACAETEIEQLKRELAEQKQLIQSLMSAQEAQKTINAKVEAQALSGSKDAASSTATAIPGVTFYGTADLNVASTNSGFGRKTSIGSGGMTASSLGVKGERNIGNGLKVVGEVEAGVDFTTGVVSNGPAGTTGLNRTGVSTGGLAGTGNQIFSRQAYAGLASGEFGTVTLGRQYTGSYITAAAIGDAMGTGFFGNAATFLPVIGGMPTRTNSSVVYRTPTLNGFSGYLTYTLGSQNNVNTPTPTAAGATTKTTDQAGRGWDVALFYRPGPLTAAFTTWNVNAASYAVGETDLATKKGYQMLLSYDFDVVKVYAQYVSGTIDGGNYENVTKTLSKSSGASVSASIPFGKHKIYGSYAKLNDDSLLNRSASLVGLAYSYELFKNTKLYGSWGRLNNNSNATYSLANGGDLVGNVSTAGFSPSGFMAGLNASF